ncbi:DUF924 domain-containing protein [Corticimicrobacter populi]|uniref:DUF924 domain-containing protein n=2 Tax=Corticimicrobacter populi TaxID=2175229 RepID=A0A2V1K2U5_9BURK|nr:DUF924 domain-containing protein [Corticimicrobacter populi]
MADAQYGQDEGAVMTSHIIPAAKEPILTIVNFWKEAGPERWFSKDEAFDQDFSSRFMQAHLAAARRRHEAWASDPDGLLALMILLDQFPRNAFRDTGHMFATDGLALHYARAGVDNGLDQQVPVSLRLFVYLPFMHAESLADQMRCVELCRLLGRSEDYAEEHLDIIRRFGRFPHRNVALGRTTTAEEQAFLDAGGFAG